MWKNKYIFLAIIPLFAIGFFTTTLLKTDKKVEVRHLVAKAEPMTGPQKIATVIAPLVEAAPDEPAPQQTQAPQPVAKAVTKPVVKSAPKVATKTTTTTRVQSSSTSVSSAPKLSATCSGGIVTQFICLLNQYRASKGLRSLSYSSAISVAAQNHSNWMSSTGIFAHQETDGSRMVDRCAAVGTVCHAENLAEGASSPQQLLDMWKASSTHNSILLGPYSLIGIGIAGPYITADFN